MTQTDTTGDRDDPGSRRPLWIALGVLLLTVLWMGSGLVLPPPPEEQAEPAAPRPVAVAVQDSTAAPVTRFFVAEGQALPDRDTAIRAETGGTVAELLAAKGDRVEDGQIIARLALPQRQADVTRAQAELDRAQRDFDNAETLLERGVVTADRLAQTRVALAAAQAALADARAAEADSLIRAPFAGQLDALDIARGEVVQAGADLGRVIDNSPLTVVFQVPQQARARLHPGLPARIDFITGEGREGPVAFVASSADPATRTFRAEVVVPNGDGAIPAGVSAQVRIPTDEQVGHFVSPAILSLGADGTLGLKTVTDDNRVEFHAVEIIEARTDGIWVSGLPERARIITVGQGFVAEGQTVAPSPAPAQGARAAMAAP